MFQRYTVYGCPFEGMSESVKGKEYLHSFLRSGLASTYVATHHNTFPNRYQEYDVYVANKHHLRITPLNTSKTSQEAV